MSKSTSYQAEGQQLSLLELGRNGWEMSPNLVILSRKHLSTKEVLKIIPLDNAAALYRARQEGSAYWYKPADLSQSKIVVPLGMRNKWMIFTPQNICS